MSDTGSSGMGHGRNNPGGQTRSANPSRLVGSEGMGLDDYSVMSLGRTPPLRAILQPTDADMVKVIDSVDQTNGFGLIVIDGPQFREVRKPDVNGRSVVVELRQPLIPQLLGPGASWASSPDDRNAGDSASEEWTALGFNCAGMIFGWIGVAGSAAFAPVTGGSTLVGSAILWGGAIAATGQCSASTYRVYNSYNNPQRNRDLDNSRMYVWTMRGADVIGLIGAGGALKEVYKTGTVVREAGAGLKTASFGDMSRPMRRAVTEGLELKGASRASSLVINSLVRQRLIDGFGGLLALTGSAKTGATKECVVWIIGPADLK